ncbi:MAG: D-2-hydroxyacid dehydrogenase [Bacteroidota bacterium]|jgi:D-3-phosphoglycerate dehydrogenase|nr:D-2-hydroxyacid dehydrogenase [Bacteroidota bacterium]
MRVLANDGIDAAGKQILEAAGFEVITNKVTQEELPNVIGEYDVLIVRSATKVNASVINASSLKLIARAGVGLDNIDMKAAGEKNIPVVNTPNASSRSVAELVFAHLFSLSRFLHKANRQMPTNGIAGFKDMKKVYSDGFELMGKKLGIIGFGRIGQEVAKMAIGLGMEVLVYDYKQREFDVVVQMAKAYQSHNFKVTLKGQSLDTVLSQSDCLTIHTPGSAEVIGAAEIAQMKAGSVLINCARGGVVNEVALAEALQSGQISCAGVDVFENEPPSNDLMISQDNCSLSPHIGASTKEAQERVGIELAEKITGFFK